MIDFSLFSYCQSLAESGESAQCDASTSDIDVCLPAISPDVSPDSRMSAFVVEPPFGVGLICRIADSAQVGEAIVAPASINVVDLLRWPNTGSNGPSDTVGEKHGTAEISTAVTAGVRTGKCFPALETNLPNPRRSRRFKQIRGPRAKPEFPGLWLIPEQLAAQFGRDIGAGSHGDDPSSLRLGRRAESTPFAARSHTARLAA